jgi:hypothetical protein
MVGQAGIMDGDEGGDRLSLASTRKGMRMSYQPIIIAKRYLQGKATWETMRIGKCADTDGANPIGGA